MTEATEGCWDDDYAPAVGGFERAADGGDER